MIPLKGSKWVRRRTGEEISVESVNVVKRTVCVCTTSTFIVTDTPLDTFAKNYKPKDAP